MDEYQMMRLCERFDSIMNSEESRRERIATAVLAGMWGNSAPEITNIEPKDMADLAIRQAETLIAELDK